jgi:hypothetical protein
MGTFTYGVYLGNNGYQEKRSTYSFLDQDNAIDLLLAGDMGAKWGARVHYAHSQVEPGTAAAVKKNSALGVSLGGKHGDMAAYLNLDLSDKSTGDGTNAAYESKIKPSYQIGGAYDWSGFNFYVDYSSNKIDYTLGTDSGYGKGSELLLGVGRIHEINPTSRFFSNAALSLATTETSTTIASVLSTTKIKTNTLPITFGMEADATSWLVVRGSVSQNVLLGQETKTVTGQPDDKKTVASSTKVNAGATLNFGKLKVDGLVGTTTTLSATGTETNTGVLSTNNLLTRVGVSYAF